MNSAAASPDRGSTLVLIDDVGSSVADRSNRSTTSPIMGSTAAQSSTSSSLRTGMPPSSTHPPDPLLYGLQTMEWRPWLRPTPGSSSTIDEYAKSPTANDEYSNYASKTTKSVHMHQPEHILDMHGVGPCRQSLYWWAKTFWTLLLLAATAGLAYEVYKTVDEFWWNGSRSGSYSIAQGSPGAASVQFPDIYVCPTNPINDTYRRRRRTDMKWFHILSALNQKSNPEGILGKLMVNWDYFPQQASVIAGPPSTNISALGWPSGSVDQPQPMPTFQEDIPNDPPPSPASIDSMREYFMRNGYELDSFLVECAFRSKPFKCAELAQPTLDRKHGKCFHFPFSTGATSWPHTFGTLSPSSGMVNASWRVSNGAQGFSLAMNIHTELYPKENGSLFDGAYLYVDWRNDPASSMFAKPILLPPGAYSTITLDATEVRVRKVTPSCYEDELQEGHRDRHNWMVLNSPRYYRQDLCKFDCILQSIIDICHCLLLIDGRYVNRSALVLERRTGNDSDPFSFSTITWSTVGYCTGEQLSECAYDILQQYDSPILNDFNNNNCTRRCRPSCHRKEYKVASNSYVKLPAESYLGSGPNYPFPWNELKNNYVIVDIVLEKGQLTVIEEGPSMSLEIFLGIVGGQMSLFLGCSLLTIVQILVLILSCCATACQRVYTGKCLTLRKTLRKMRHSSLLK